jgi:branched-chain amino acid transport system ATP-binding protein
VLLEAIDVGVRFRSVHAVDNVALHVAKGEIVAVLGANGAGKSSLLRGLLGVEKASGQVKFEGEDISHESTHVRVRRGLVLVPEGRRIVIGLTVEENLLLGAYPCRDHSHVRSRIAALYDRFPNLAERRHQLAGVLSGGEQQMLAIGRATMASPKLMMLDEPSLGLSPKLSAEVLTLIGDLRRREGLTILLVEQNTSAALQLADRAYVLELGRVVKSGTPQELRADSTIEDAYFGSRGTKTPRLVINER